MLKALSKWFGESQMAIPEDKVLQCKHESHTQSCNLVEKLKVKQAEKRQINEELRGLHNPPETNLLGIRRFYDLFMDSFVGTRCSRCPCATEQDILIMAISNVIDRLSSEDVDTICSDIKQIKSRQELIKTKVSCAVQLDVEIADIKAALGID